MHKAIEFKINGTFPLMMHNGQLANPLNPFARKMKELTGKRNKTEEDYQKIADLEWEGGLYIDDKRRPVIPGHVIEATLISAGKKQRLGDKFKAGVVCDGFWPVLFDGPKDLAKLKADPRFRDMRAVTVDRKKIIRCRPIFKTWSLEFTVQYLPSLLNESQIVAAVRTAGEIGGLAEGRPRYGRFEVEERKAIAA